jgi:hypothetical protein
MPDDLFMIQFPQLEFKYNKLLFISLMWHLGLAFLQQNHAFSPSKVENLNQSGNYSGSRRLAQSVIVQIARFRLILRMKSQYSSDFCDLTF